MVGLAVFAAAWISDDALVTFRTVENFVSGAGIRWNAADRTQTATHPLWVLALGAVRLCTGELYYTTIGFSLALSMAAVALLARAAVTRTAAVATGLGALASISFVEFGTCGLENALVYVLVAAFAHAWFASADGERRLRRLGVLGALLALGRQDLVLLVLPCLLAALRGVPLRRSVRCLAPGALLVAAWYGFAWIYFGTVVPTPGYSKVLALDLPWSAMLQQGWWYLLDLVCRDPASAVTLVLAMALGVWTRQLRYAAPAIGVALQVLYTLRVGGDFMSGRFFTAAFVLGLSVVAQARSPRLAVAAALGYVVLAWIPGVPSWLRATPAPAEARIEHGIGNERSYYAGQLGLWSPTRVVPPYGSFGAPYAVRLRPPVVLVTAAGVPGYLFGPHVHLVDPFLCDPLLVRLPIEDRGAWRIGHYKRRLPEGYLETLATGENRIVDPDLARYWDALATLLRAPIWSQTRWQVWWGFQTGAYDELLRRYATTAYVQPPCVERSYRQLPRAVADGAMWWDVPSIVVREGGLRIACERQVRARSLRLAVDGAGEAEVQFWLGARQVGAAEAVVPAGNGARWLAIAVPAGVETYDAIRLVPRITAATPEAKAVSMLEVLAVLAAEIGD
jgi:arabinofuranosyltransferase